MKAYYFNRSKTKNVFYIPRNLILVVKNETFFDVDYKVNNIKAFDLIWNSGNTPEKRKLFGCLEEAVVNELEVPTELVQDFQDYCWDETPLNIARAHLFAIQMYYLAKKSIKKFREK